MQALKLYFREFVCAYGAARNDLKMATAAKMRTAMIAAVQMIFQIFSGIFVLRFITQRVSSSARLCSGTKKVQNEKGGSRIGKPPGLACQYTISSQGRPYSLSFCMKGAGSNSSMLKTPGPFQVPVASIMAPIMAGTPVV